MCLFLDIYCCFAKDLRVPHRPAQSLISETYIAFFTIIKITSGILEHLACFSRARLLWTYLFHDT